MCRDVYPDDHRSTFAYRQWDLRQPHYDADGNLTLIESVKSYALGLGIIAWV